MGVVILYGIANCDTVKKARAWLDQHGVEYRFHDYKVAGVEGDRLRKWCAQLGWEALLNRAGTTFRKLPETEKAASNVEEAIALMRAHPSAIKRPVLERGRKVVVGFKPELYQSLKW
jgi:arsenate reductase